MWGHLSSCEPLAVTPVQGPACQFPAAYRQGPGEHGKRPQPVCIPGWKGPWWTSQRLERGWFCSPQACKREDVVEQEHVPAGMQKLSSQQAGDPQKHSAQGESPQMSVAKSCLGVCLGPELCLASCRTREGIPSHNGG